MHMRLTSFFFFELLQAIVHAADLSGQTLDKGIAYSFGRGVLQEFHAQVLN